MSVRGRCCAAGLTGAVALLVSGCGSLSADEVESAAATFAAADDDPAARCRLLAANVVEALVEDGSSCEDAIQELPVGSGDVTSVEVWGEEAQARLTDDTVFLTRTAHGWRVTAAACRSQGADLPYTCGVEG